MNPWTELETIFPQISSPKGMFGRNKKKFDFSRLSFDSRNSQKIALNSTVLYFSFRHVILYTVTLFKVSLRSICLVSDEGPGSKRFLLNF